MKELILMRHGKSSWKHVFLDDFDRPLKKRGKKEALFMAELLQDKKLLPDLILASSAKRTRQTTELVNEIFELGDSQVQFLDSFYLAGENEFIKELSRLNNSIERVMIIGHNPTMEFFTVLISGEVHSFSTAAVAHIELDISSWKNLTNSKRNGKLLDLWRPKELITDH